MGNYFFKSTDPDVFDLHDCTVEQLTEAAEGAFLVTGALEGDWEKESVFGMVSLSGLSKREKLGKFRLFKR